MHHECVGKLEPSVEGVIQRKGMLPDKAAFASLPDRGFTSRVGRADVRRSHLLEIPFFSRYANPAMQASADGDVEFGIEHSVMIEQQDPSVLRAQLIMHHLKRRVRQGAPQENHCATAAR